MSANNTAKEQAGFKQNLFAITSTESPLVSKNFELVMSQMNIPNSIAFKKDLQQQWQSAAHNGQLLSLLFCEVDFLHEYVENYGIQAASFMLISIALCLKSICDEHDCFLARNEQQGFTVLLKGRPIQEVQALAEKLCSAVRQAKTEHKYAKNNGFITMSIGISSLYPTSKAILKDKAKHRLISAKKGGGNRVNEIKLSSTVTEMKNKVEVNDKVEKNLNNDNIKKQHKVSHQEDLLAIPEEQSTATRPTITTTYRGQITEKHTQNNAVHAPKRDPNAPNEDDISLCNKSISSKKSVRMYRGQIISD